MQLAKLTQNTKPLAAKRVPSDEDLPQLWLIEDLFRLVKINRQRAASGMGEHFAIAANSQESMCIRWMQEYLEGRRLWAWGQRAAYAAMEAADV